MRFHILAAIVALSFTSPVAALAQTEEPTSKYFLCWSNLYSGRHFTKDYYVRSLINQVQASKLTVAIARLEWEQFVRREEPSLVIGSALCNEYRTADEAEREHARKIGSRVLSPNRSVAFQFSDSDDTRSAAAEKSKPKISEKPGISADMADQEQKSQVATREEREARKQEKEAKYQAELAAWNATIEAQKEAEARKQAAHAANQDAAARANAAFEQKKGAHARLIEEHMKLQMDYEAAQLRHTLCINGNRKACDEIAAGKPATGEQAARSETTGQQSNADDYGIYRVVGPLRPDRDRALAGLMASPRSGGYFDVQCDDMQTGGGKIVWTCAAKERRSNRTTSGSSQ